MKRDFKRCKVQTRVFEALSHTLQKNRISCKQWNARYDNNGNDSNIGEILAIVVVVITVQ